MTFQAEYMKTYIRYFPFLCPFLAVILGSLSKFRLLPMMIGDTIRQGGELRPTAPFAETMANMFYAFAAFTFLVALFSVFILPKLRREN